MFAELNLQEDERPPDDGEKEAEEPGSRVLARSGWGEGR